VERRNKIKKKDALGRIYFEYKIKHENTNDSELLNRSEQFNRSTGDGKTLFKAIDGRTTADNYRSNV
jgi:hypothetical protein